LNSITFDGNSKNFAFDKYVGKLKQYFIDLGREVPEAYKIRKLMDSLNVSSLGNIYPMIKASPQHRNDFDATLVFIQDQLAALATKHAGKRSVSFAKKREASEMTKMTKSNLGTNGPKEVAVEVVVVAEAEVGEEVVEEEEVTGK
jgi:hypothetical protein